MGRRTIAFTRRMVTGAGAALATAGCSPLSIFDTLAPRDRGAVRAATGLAYGPHPRQALDIYVPAPGRGPPKGLPVLVFFYGGSWKSGSKADYGFVGQAFAASGFVTAIADYRLFPEFGFPTFLQDGASAVRFVHAEAERFGGDPRRLVLAGHSAGAYNAAMLALNARYLAEAGLRAGIVRAFAGLSGPYDFLPLDPGTAQEVFGPVADRASTQPITFASASSPPAFLATGAADDVVRPRNTASLAARLRGRGVEVVERIYPDLDHADTLLALSVPFRRWAPILSEAGAFLAGHAHA